MTLTKSRAAKLVAGLVGFAMVFSFVVSTADALTSAEIQAQIAALQAQLSSVSGGSSTGYTFNTNLTVGSRGTDVMNLQKVLNMSSDTMVASVGAGSPGSETTYFGNATKAAVMKFQSKFGISPVAGYVGAITRAKLNSMSGPVVVVPPACTSNCGTTLPTGGSLMVTAGSQPMNSLAPQSAARIPFTTVVLTAGSSDVTVNSITVERSGLAQDAVFSGIVLLDQNGLQIGIAKTLNSNHQAMVGEPFVIQAGTSKAVTIAGNMSSTLTNYAGQVAGLNVVAVNTTASVAGSFPIMGAMHTVNASLTLGSAQLAVSSFDPNSAQSKEIGTTGYKFAGVRVTAGSAEQVKLWSVRFNQTGSASSQDLTNVKVYVDGTAYDTTVSSDGKYYSALFPGGLLIDKGNSKDLYIQGDIVGSSASGRTVQFDLYKTTDIYLSGVTYGYGITPTASNTGSVTTSSEFTTGTPFFSGSLVTVTGGSATTIQKATSVAAQNVAVNVPGQILGGFTTDIKGEPISVQSLVFSVSTSAPVTAPLTNVTIVDQNGAVVAGPVDEVAAGTLTFTDTVTFPVGQKTYTLKGKLASSFSNGATVAITTNPSTQWTNVTGQTTGNSITLTNGAFTMNTMTVKSATLAVSVSSSPAAQSIVAGGQGVVLANYQFDASQSGEDVRFSTFAVNNSGSTSGLSSCQLYDGSTPLNTGSNVVNPSTATPTFTLDSQFVVPKGTVKTLTLKCNVASGAAGPFQFGILGSQITALSATGVTSSNTVVATGSTAAGQAQSVANGSLAVSIDPSTSNFTTVAAGSTGITVGSFKFRPSNETINLTKVALVLSTSTAADLMYGNVSLWQGATKIGTASFTGSNLVATSTLDTSITLAKDADTFITIKADLANIGTSDTGTEGRLIKIDVISAEGTGVSSGNTLTPATAVVAGVSGVRMFKSFPTVSQEGFSSTFTSSGLQDGRLMRFKITADTHGPVSISNLNFTIATSGTASTNTNVGLVMLNVYSQSDYTGAVGGTFGTATGQFGTTTAAGLASNPSLNFSALTNPLQIPAGTTYYFELKGAVAGVTTGSSVTTTLNGDAAPLLIQANGSSFVASTTLGIIIDPENDFVWSGNATSTPTFSSNDWSNGYGIPGLSASGFSTTRSQ
ncbi:MAG: peptidoglycan-binding domain-containing protein [Patescibacteria group bacterium]